MIGALASFVAIHCIRSWLLLHALCDVHVKTHEGCSVTSEGGLHPCSFDIDVQETLSQSFGRLRVYVISNSFVRQCRSTKCECNTSSNITYWTPSVMYWTWTVLHRDVLGNKTLWYFIPVTFIWNEILHTDLFLCQTSKYSRKWLVKFMLTGLIMKGNTKRCFFKFGH
jgi:hypothetical protein